MIICKKTQEYGHRCMDSGCVLGSLKLYYFVMIENINHDNEDAYRSEVVGKRKGMKIGS